MGYCLTPPSLLAMVGLIPYVILQFSEPVSTLNDEGWALLRLREAVEVDPYGFLSNWVDEGDGDPPCSFAGVLCQDGRVVTLNLGNLGLKGKLSPELQNLVHLRHLILNDNYFYGTVPREIGELRELEILNLSYNNLHGSLPSFLQNPKSLPFIAAIEGNSFDTSLSTNKIYVNYHGQRSLLQDSQPSSSPSPSPSPSPSLATPIKPNSPPFLSPPPTNTKTSEGMIGLWTGIGISIVVLFLVFLTLLIWFCKSGKGVDVTPLAAATLSDQLQQALVKGVPTLNHEELRVACEDFSNEIGSHPDGIVFKGNLSNGAEIAVVVNKKDNGCWTQTCQEQFRSKIEILSKVNHKNLVNLVGYSEEDDPFSRMMVFEYASNGSLYEHIHPNVGEREHLSWLERMRIIMGVGYFLFHINRLDPPHILQNLTSETIFLTDDLAAKVSHLALLEPKKTKTEEAKIVHMFGILLLELITGRKPHSFENEGIVRWAFDYLDDEKSQVQMLDPTLTSFQISNVGPICKIIKSCLDPNPIDRPSIKDVVLQLNKITGISHMSAVPRSSPLWWAELEIVSSSNPGML